MHTHNQTRQFNLLFNPKSLHLEYTETDLPLNLRQMESQKILPKAEHNR